MTTLSYPLSESRQELLLKNVPLNSEYFVFQTLCEVHAGHQPGSWKIVDNCLYIKDYENEVRLRKTFEQVCSAG
jgi:hypothetical protein